MPVKQLRVRAARSSQHQRVGGKAERCLNEGGRHNGSRQLDLEVDLLMVMLSHVPLPFFHERGMDLGCPRAQQISALRRQMTIGSSAHQRSYELNAPGDPRGRLLVSTGAGQAAGWCSAEGQASAGISTHKA